MMVSRAFKELPSSYAIQQSVMRFVLDSISHKLPCMCQCNANSIEEALGIVVWYNHVHGTVADH